MKKEHVYFLLEGSKEVKIRGGQYLDRMVWGRAVRLIFVIASCAFKLVCGRALC